ncbi:MAG: putative quinol monooxygenase [Acidimicrobiia bacterium]
MSVTVMFEFHVQGDKVSELKGVLKAILPDTRAYDGCQSVTVHQDQDEPTTLVVYETWASRPQYEKYLAWRTETGAVASLGEALAEAPSLRFFDTVDA